MTTIKWVRSFEFKLVWDTNMLGSIIVGVKEATPHCAGASKILCVVQLCNVREPI